MFFAPVIRRSAYVPSLRAVDRFFDDTFVAPSRKAAGVEQDDKAYTLTLDVPGIAREQLSVGIEGNVVRIQTQAGAPRQYSAVYELPQDVDAAASEAKLEHGVLTLKLGKKQPVSNVTQLAIH